MEPALISSIDVVLLILKKSRRYYPLDLLRHTRKKERLPNQSVTFSASAQPRNGFGSSGAVILVLTVEPLKNCARSPRENVRFVVERWEELRRAPSRKNHRCAHAVAMHRSYAYQTRARGRYKSNRSPSAPNLSRSRFIHDLIPRQAVVERSLHLAVEEDQPVAT